MTNKYIKATYKLYDVTDGKKELLEETQPSRSMSERVLVLLIMIWMALWWRPSARTASV